MPLPTIRPWWASENGDDGGEDEPDDEQASLLQDMRGMHLHDSNHMDSSPQPALEPGARGALGKDPDVKQPRGSSNSRHEHRAEAHQIQIDEIPNPPHDELHEISIVPVKSITLSAASHSITSKKATRHVWSKSETSKHPARLTQEHRTASQENARIGRACWPLTESTQQGAQLDLLLQLDKITQERNTITARLHELNQKERELLSRFVSTILPPTNELISCNYAHGNALVEKEVQVTTKSTIRKPMRTLSASADSIPTTSRKHNPCHTARRVPLADNTEESLAVFDSTLIFSSEESHESPIKPEKEPVGKQRSLPASPTKSKLPKRTNRTTRVPTKFNDEEIQQKTPKAKNKQRGRRDMPQKEMAEAEEKGAAGSQVVETPNVPKDYEVPFTVKRKKWEF